ncbi:GAF domain-containing protein [Mycobacterium sp. 21AC1]|uniref:GAF domain-containing protein n=1 Tax=[Mycobacterium] appelbergii TaxID=2939269 RepID=UPI0029392968|nr:GAF domain-containing protein [Mycobacterium sp. 21AC1]MDV3126943.1 GAF domain-containing protein [Mycobacterium sp. 21AC1]
MSGIGGYEAARIERAIAELMRPSPGCVDIDPYAVVARLTMAAVEHISSVSHAGVTLVGRKKIIRSLAATDGYPLVLDNIQRRLLEGPCYESAAGHQVIRVDDLTAESRWPNFVERSLAATPIRSFLTLPLFTNARGGAALNLYSNRARALDADTESAGELFAEHAARLLKAGRAPRPASRASGATDVVVEEATRMLVQRYRIDVGTATSILENLSIEHHQPMVETARQLVGRDRFTTQMNG